MKRGYLEEPLDEHVYPQMYQVTMPGLAHSETLLTATSAYHGQTFSYFNGVRQNHALHTCT